MSGLLDCVVFASFYFRRRRAHLEALNNRNSALLGHSGVMEGVWEQRKWECCYKGNVPFGIEVGEISTESIKPKD